MSALLIMAGMANTATPVIQKPSYQDPDFLKRELAEKLKWFSSLPEASRLGGMHKAKLAVALVSSLQFRAAIGGASVARFDEILQRAMERMAELEASEGRTPLKIALTSTARRGMGMD